MRTMKDRVEAQLLSATMHLSNLLHMTRLAQDDGLRCLSWPVETPKHYGAVLMCHALVQVSARTPILPELLPLTPT